MPNHLATKSACRLVTILLCAFLPACAPSTTTPIPSQKSATAVPVLMYHEISTSRPASETVIPPDRFTEQMQFLADHHYHTLTIPELLDFLKGKPVPEKSLLLTFDDGWKNQSLAVSLLKQHHFKAAFFIFTGAPDNNFGPEYLSWNEIESLSREPLFEIASHSITHPWNPADNLMTWSQNKPAGKSIADVRRELVDSKKSLESHLRKPIIYWAWPCGWYTPPLTEEAKNAGYVAQFTTYQQPNLPGGDPHQIRRYFINGTWDLNTFTKFLTRATKPPPPDDTTTAP